MGAQRGRGSNISSTVAAGSSETERTELQQCESEGEDAQFVSSDEVRDSDSEIVVILQDRERPIGLSNIDDAILTDDRVIQHSRSLRSEISRLDTNESVIETEDINRKTTGNFEQPPASLRREAADSDNERQPPASFWREAADNERQPPASFRREATDYDRPRPASFKRDTADINRQHRLHGQRRSLSADQCDAELRNEPSCRSRPRFGSVTSESRRVDHSIEMPRFDGAGDLQLFLQRFNTIADYYNWAAEEKLFRLKNCIHGDAQYLLVDLVGVTNSEQLIDVLKTRFGTTAHAERYRAELGQLRRGKLTLEQLHM